MLEPQFIVHLLLAVTEFLAGVLANGTIVLVTGLDVVKQSKKAPLDLLLCCLATSRIGFQVSLFYVNLIVLSVVEFCPTPESYTLFMFVGELGLWFATWLSVFYCAKIAPIAHPLFSWLKRRISKLVPWLVLGTLLYTSVISVLHRKYTWVISQNIWLSFFFPNVTAQIREIPMLQSAFLVTNAFLPLLIFLTSALLLIFSLGRHTRQMKSAVAGNRPPSMTVHVSAILSILSFLVLYLTQYMMGIILLSQNFKVRNFTSLFAILVLGSYPSGHSIILISGNPKLKQGAKKFLPHSTCCR